MLYIWLCADWGRGGGRALPKALGANSAEVSKDATLWARGVTGRLLGASEAGENSRRGMLAVGGGEM